MKHSASTTDDHLPSCSLFFDGEAALGRLEKAVFGFLGFRGFCRELWRGVTYM